MHSSAWGRSAIAAIAAASLLAPATATAEPTTFVTAQPAKTGTCANRPIIERGHVDIAATGGKTDLGIVLKDDTNTTPGVKERRLDSVILGVSDTAKKTRKDVFTNPFFNFVGLAGAPFYFLPKVEDKALLWPGYNTEKVDFADIDGPVTLHIDIAGGPKNGHVAMFHDEFGKFTPLLNTATRDTTIDIDDPTHVHTNWIFTQPGTYALNVWYTARTKTGKDLTSEVQKATFAIGNDAVATAKDTSNCTTPTPQPNPGDDHGTGPSTPGQSGDQSSGSSLGAGATAGIAAAAVIGAGLLALLAANIPAITGWLSNLTGR
ncbi:choice-of-anchor M domain-containing protein [Corynebacterium timonense]|uniref:Surface-anchored protein n=1 Tax=Corynebacterium timonense TaxID=441500 RepID=A0A1H1PVF8_9CORY|nr:choice-of-anchor M domain-containing protein [Corynebacterium timonense]SDS15210.1 surface-anchored protein [Corynebacterium timonense]